MEIFYIHKALFQNRPPVISAVLILNDLGHNVKLISEGISDYWKEQFKERGISYFEIPKKGKKNILNSIIEYIHFRKEVYSILKDKATHENSLLWIESAYTMVALGTGIKKYKYILQIQELHEEIKYQLKAIGKVIQDAQTVFMPEYNRAVLYQVWFKLTKRPVVLPNKPYFLPTKDALLKLEAKYSSLIPLFKENKVILYQGHISSDRDLSSYVHAVRSLGSGYKLVLLGRDHDMLESYLKIDPEIIHIDFMPAPDYLLFTSLSYIGLLSYSPISENNIYCAPNKIYEYTAYGLPIIGNDIPGLYYPIKMNHFGEIVDETNSNSIKEAILKIDQHFSTYSKNARLFYDKINNKDIIKKYLINNILYCKIN